MLLWGIQYQQGLSFMISLPLTDKHTHKLRYKETQVWHAFVQTFFVSREQGTLCRGGCPCSVSALSPYIPKPHLSLNQPSNGSAFRC